MSTSETAATAVAEAPKPKTKKQRKAAKKTAPKASRDGLRKPQIRILQCLMRNSKPLTRAQIAEKAPVDVAACVEYLGSHDDSVRKTNDKKHFPSLVSLGFVRHEQHAAEDFGGDKGRDIVVYSITALGKKKASKTE